MSGTVVIGVGNPILGDDAVGLHVAHALARALGPEDRIDVKELHAGGIRVMDAVDGYEHAVIVDAMCSGVHPPGFVRRLTIDELGHARNLTSTHDTNLPTALALGRTLGMRMPQRVTVIGIEIRAADTFQAELSEAVAAAVPDAVRLIAGEVGS